MMHLCVTKKNSFILVMFWDNWFRIVTDYRQDNWGSVSDRDRDISSVLLPDQHWDPYNLSPG